MSIFFFVNFFLYDDYIECYRNIKKEISGCGFICVVGFIGEDLRK